MSPGGGGLAVLVSVVVAAGGWRWCLVSAGCAGWRWCLVSAGGGALAVVFSVGGLAVVFSVGCGLAVMFSFGVRMRACGGGV